MMLVSVVIPTFNGERFLEEAIESVVAQTYTNIEIIVVDDGSTTDKCKCICDDFGDRVKYISQVNSGVSAARNNGIKNSSGDLVAFLDDDDVWLPEKIERQVDLYLNNKNIGTNVGLIYTGYTAIDEGGEEIKSVIFKASGNVFDKILITDFVTLPSSVLISRDVINNVGLFDVSLSCSQDYEYWIRIARKYEIYYVNDFLIKYRKVKNSLSSNVDLKVKLILDNLLPKVTQMIEERDSDFIDQVKSSFVKEGAIRYKQHAYLNLYEGGNGEVFRRYIMKAAALNEGTISIKDWLFFYVSKLSPALLVYISSKINKTSSNNKLIIDVE